MYFPLPANDAQQEIMRRLRRQRGVLVQGPPGTGKSHTIVNLVSHLLATDQRVLVTSHTARALKVLRDKFPPELASLCVTHLRGEEGARAMLERSVGEILQPLRPARTVAGETSDEQRCSAHSNAPGRTKTGCWTPCAQIRQAETDLLDSSATWVRPSTSAGAAGSRKPSYGWLEDLNDAAQDAPLSDARPCGC